MAGTHADIVKYLKSKIQLFEDKKISRHDLAKEMFYVAREIFDPEDAPLRQSLVRLANRLSATEDYPKALALVDEVQSELIDQGYALS